MAIFLIQIMLAAGWLLNVMAARSAVFEGRPLRAVWHTLLAGCCVAVFFAGA